MRRLGARLLAGGLRAEPAAPGGPQQLLAAASRSLQQVQQCSSAAGTASAPPAGSSGGEAPPPAHELRPLASSSGRHSSSQLRWIASSSSSSGDGPGTEAAAPAHASSLNSSSSSSGSPSSCGGRAGGAAPVRSLLQRRWQAAAGAAAAPLQWRGAHTGSSGSSSELEEEPEGSDADAAEEQRRQEETAAQMLAAGGTLATEAAKALEMLQTRAGLSREQAEWCLERIRNYGPPEHKCSRLRTPAAFSADNELARVLDFLLEVLRERRHVKYSLLRCPHILVGSYGRPITASSPEQWRANLRALTELLGLSEAEAVSLLKRQPLMLRMDPEKVGGVLRVLRQELALSPEELRAAVLRYPPVLSADASVVPRRLASLRAHGVSDEALRKGFVRYAGTVMLTEARVSDTFGWLLGQGVQRANLSRVVAAFPVILSQGAGKREAWVRFMREEVGADQDTIALVLTKYPDTVGRSFELLRRNLGSLRALGLSEHQIRRVLSRNAGVLRLDLGSPTYAPKIAFLREVIQLSEEEVAEALATHPFFVSYRLERMAPRGAYMRRLGRPTTSLSSWLAPEERAFAVNCARTSYAEYAAFLADWRDSEEGRRWLDAAAARKERMSGRSLVLEEQGREESLADSAARLRALLAQAEARLERSVAAAQALKQAWLDAKAAAAAQPDSPGGRERAERERRTAKAAEIKAGSDRARVAALRRTLESLEGDMAAAAAAAPAQVAARA